MALICIEHIGCSTQQHLHLMCWEFNARVDDSHYFLVPKLKSVRDVRTDIGPSSVRPSAAFCPPSFSVKAKAI